MNLQRVEWVWLDTSETITLSELSRCCGLREDELEELVEYCALVPLEPREPAPKAPVFSAEWIAPLRSVARLRTDFDLDLFAVARPSQSDRSAGATGALVAGPTAGPCAAPLGWDAVSNAL